MGMAGRRTAALVEQEHGQTAWASVSVSVVRSGTVTVVFVIEQGGDRHGGSSSGGGRTMHVAGYPRSSIKRVLRLVDGPGTDSAIITGLEWKDTRSARWAWRAHTRFWGLSFSRWLELARDRAHVQARSYRRMYCMFVVSE